VPLRCLQCVPATSFKLTPQLTAQDTLEAIQCPPYCSREAQEIDVPQLLTGNDVWMLAHILLVLAFRSAMPTRMEKGKVYVRYPGEKDANPPGSGAAVYREYLAGNQMLSERLQRPANEGIRSARTRPLKCPHCTSIRPIGPAAHARDTAQLAGHWGACIHSDSWA
jgi:hypothetical protein